MYMLEQMSSEICLIALVILLNILAVLVTYRFIDDT